jgi:hypothetical protein
MYFTGTVAKCGVRCITDKYVINKLDPIKKHFR